MQRSDAVIYLAVFSFFLAGASIAPIQSEKDSSLSSEICPELERKVPCQRAEGAWAHICLASVSVSCKSVAVALEMSRHLPDHILHFLVTVAHLENSEGAVRGVVQIVGAALGLGLLLMGRALYMPLLFYLPAILVGYASAKPLESYLETSIGLGRVYTCVLGSLVGLLFAHLQRTLFVRLLGLLVGLVSFIMLLVSTSLLLDAPFQAVIALGVLAALVGSVIVAQIEQTGPWKVMACALVGSVLLTDAIGVWQLSPFAQGAICSMLVLTSCFRQFWGAEAMRAKEAAAKAARAKAEEEEWEAGGGRRKAGRWSVGGMLGGGGGDKDKEGKPARRAKSFGGVQLPRRGAGGARTGVVEEEEDELGADGLGGQEEEYDSEEEERRMLEKMEQKRKAREARREAEKAVERERGREQQVWRRAARAAWWAFKTSAWAAGRVVVGTGKGVAWLVGAGGAKKEEEKKKAE